MVNGRLRRGYEFRARHDESHRSTFHYASYRSPPRVGEAVGSLAMDDGKEAVRTLAIWRTHDKFEHFSNTHICLAIDNARRADWKIWHLFCQVFGVRDEFLVLLMMMKIYLKKCVSFVGDSRWASLIKIEQMRWALSAETINRIEECCRIE